MSVKDKMFTDTPAENFYELQDLLGNAAGEFPNSLEHSNITPENNEVDKGITSEEVKP